MAEGICYICNQSYTAPSQSALVDQIVGYMMAQHWGASQEGYAGA